MTIPQQQAPKGHGNFRQGQHPAFKYLVRAGILVKLIAAFFLLFLIDYYL